MNLDDVPESVPRVYAEDAGDQWVWTDPQGWRHNRDKTAGPLPAIVTEVHHRRTWRNGDKATQRSILLLPPKGTEQ